MILQTFQLGFRAVPSPESPRHSSHGEAFVVCWIVRPTIELAESLARSTISAEGWEILALDYGHVANRSDYDDPEELELFDQAQLDGEVYEFHYSPRFTTFSVHAAISRRRDSGVITSEAYYLVCNETLAPPDCDFFDPEFWNEERRATALDRAKALVQEAGWELDDIKSAAPVDWLTADDELRELAELAEDDGECLVLVHLRARLARPIAQRHRRALVIRCGCGSRQLVQSMRDKLAPLLSLALLTQGCEGTEESYRRGLGGCRLQRVSESASTALSNGSR